MFSLFAGLVALACALASACRLALAAAPTSLDPKLLVEAFDQDATRWTSLRDALIARGLPWESDLFAAFARESDAEREAGVSEQLLELDWRSQRLARVPRVCASVSTSAGFLFASVALMRALASPEPDSASALIAALDALTFGIAGTSFCVAVHFRARRLLRERLHALDRLVDRLRVLARSEG
jgi:hypothetical protein